MARPSLETLKSWAIENGVTFGGVEPQDSKTFNGGTGVLATKSIESKVKKEEEQVTLLRVPQEMILSIESVQEIAKTTPILSEILENLGNSASSLRSTILAYLLLLCCFPEHFENTKSKTHNVWVSYLPYFPPENPLPTAWEETHLQAAMQTTLGSALQAKLARLSDEFNEMKSCFSSAGLHDAQSSSTRPLSLQTWHWLDAMYRSRGLELPSKKCCLVPVIDMTNHASRTGSNSAYQIDSNGDIVLLLDRDKSLVKDDEVFISYGDEKGACEMLFSYGFLEDNPDATSLLLSLSDPDDDPLFLAKKFTFDVPPGLRLARMQTSTEIRWSSEFVWLFCVNEEDGLSFSVLKEDGERKVQALWKGEALKDIDALVERLFDDQWAKVFALRADEFVAMRVREEVEIRRRHARETEETTDPIFAQIAMLEKQELALLKECLDQLETKSAHMADDEVIKDWLRRNDESRYEASEEIPGGHEY